MVTTLVYIAYINVILFVFNLIPIPPLDGSRMVGYFLRGEAKRIYTSLEPFGFYYHYRWSSRSSGSSYQVPWAGSP